jgi:hypothetical protein
VLLGGLAIRDAILMHINVFARRHILMPIEQAGVGKDALRAAATYCGRRTSQSEG